MVVLKQMACHRDPGRRFLILGSDVTDLRKSSPYTKGNVLWRALVLITLVFVSTVEEVHLTAPP